jgi:hypothetical protein
LEPGHGLPGSILPDPKTIGNVITKPNHNIETSQGRSDGGRLMELVVRKPRREVGAPIKTEPSPERRVNERPTGTFY